MNKKFRLGLVLSSLALAAVVLMTGGSAPTAHAQEPEGAAKVFVWDANGNNAKDKSYIGTNNNKPFVIKTNKVERARITGDGFVGIGTNNPLQQLEVNGITSMGAPGSVYGFRVQDSNGDVFPTIGFNAYGAPNYTAGANGFGGVLQFQNKDGKLIYYTGPNVSANDARTNTPRLTIDANGKVGIGETDPQQTLDVTGDLQVSNSSGLYSLHVGTNRQVSVGALAPSTTNHLCYFGTFTLSTCSSAAEYVPSIDSGKGYPQTADLVSIAPDVRNPYGDRHGPFVVEKSTKACDSNLLGYIVNPASGADGVNLNKHYLPLAIYGYFPAKVTVENGPIKRGDPITSSSKPGYGMKATDACKVIGYALEDTTSEDVIQVFANYGDNSAAQVQKLQQENDELKQQVAQFESRLTTLEGIAAKKVDYAAVTR